jgi:LysR family glycine cleavage system transcriptional activator
VAETGSYSKAGGQLNVTYAAVSQQVKSLETRLGVPLVIRVGRGITLTTEGAGLARDLDKGFATIRDGIETLTGADAARPVQITTSPAFASEWLMPRIPEFQHLHPEITLMLNPSVEVMELKPGGIDLAIRYRDRRTADKEGTPFLISDTVVIGTPSLLGERALGDPATLMAMPWLEELGTNNVADWFERRGVTLDRPLMVSQMPGNLIMQAVRRGDGITHTIRAFFQAEIRSGSVVELFSEPAFGIFYMVTAPGVMRPAVKTFLNWLNSKAETVTATADDR